MTPLPTDRPVVRWRFPVRKPTGFDRFVAEQAMGMSADMLATCKRVYEAQEMFLRKYATGAVATGTVRITRDDLAKRREL